MAARTSPRRKRKRLSPAQRKAYRGVVKRKSPPKRSGSKRRKVDRALRAYNRAAKQTHKKAAKRRKSGPVKVRGYTRRGAKSKTQIAVRAYVRAGGGRVVSGSGGPKRKSSKGSLPPPYTGGGGSGKGGGYGDYGAWKRKQKSKGRARRGTATIGRPKFGPITTDPMWHDPNLARKKRQQKARKTRRSVSRRSGGRSW